MSHFKWEELGYDKGVDIRRTPIEGGYIYAFLHNNGPTFMFVPHAIASNVPNEESEPQPQVRCRKCGSYSHCHGGVSHDYLD